MLVRGPGLAESMSQYLIDRISATANIEVLLETEVTALTASHAGRLDRVRWKNRKTGEETERAIRNLFLFIGADPATDWLRDCGIALDKNGFVKTGFDAGVSPGRSGSEVHQGTKHQSSVLGSSLSAMCAPAPSNASAAPSGKEQPSSRNCTLFSASLHVVPARLAADDDMRFRFWGVDATSGEASPSVLPLGEGPLSLAASDALVSPAAAVHGFRATEVLGLIDLTSPVFCGVRTRYTSFRTRVLR
jgi:hypothetical protein